MKLFPHFTRHDLITRTNLIDFIISIETEALLLALAKSIYYCKKKKTDHRRLQNVVRTSFSGSLAATFLLATFVHKERFSNTLPQTINTINVKKIDVCPKA